MKSLNISDMKFVPWSDRIALGAPKVDMSVVERAFATSLDVCCFSGTAMLNLLNKSKMVNMYSCPLFDWGSGPTMSIATLSNGSPGESVMIIGALSFTRTSLFFWQSKQCLIKYLISSLMPFQ